MLPPHKEQQIQSCADRETEKLWKTQQDKPENIILSASGRKLNHPVTCVAAYGRAERKQKAGGSQKHEGLGGDRK